MAFINSKGGSKWANTQHPRDPAELEDLTCIVYLDPGSKKLLIQWLYEGFKPYTEPAFFYRTDLMLLRRDVARGFNAIVRGPKKTKTEYAVTRHMTYDDMLDIVRGRYTSP